MKIYKLLLKKFKRYRNVSFWIEDRYVHIEVDNERRTKNRIWTRIKSNS